MQSLAVMGVLKKVGCISAGERINRTGESKVCTTSWGFTDKEVKTKSNTHTHPLNGTLSRTTRVSRYQKGKPVWILLKQETVSCSGIRWAIGMSAPRSRQITTPAPHHSVFYRPDALPATQPAASKHWRQKVSNDKHLPSHVEGCQDETEWLEWNWLKTHTRLTALCPGLPRWAGTRKVKPIWILLKQETVSLTEDASEINDFWSTHRQCRPVRALIHWDLWISDLRP